MKIDLQRALLLAPLAELTHAAFRRLLYEYGVPDLYFTEMLSAPGLRAENTFTPWYLDLSPAPRRTVVQLVGREPEHFRAAAEKIADAEGVYGFDINMGCSVSKITRRGWGVALMREPERAAEILETLRRAFPNHSVSAKLRLGDREDEHHLLKVARALEAAGADFLTLHPKTSRTVRSRPAKWSYVALLRRELGIPVVGNGGVDGAQALRRCREQAGTGGVMIGRGAVCRPWIFARLRAAEVASAAAQSQGLHKLPDLPETEQGRETARSLDLQALGRRELELIASLLPEEFHLSRARRFFFYLCDNLRFGYRLKMHMQEAPELEDISRMWAHYFERNPDEREIIFG